MFRMILSKRKKILLFLLFGIILCSFIFYENNLTGFTTLSLKENKSIPCKDIENDFIRDVCYLEKKDNYGDDGCYLIKDIYLQYMCLRLEFRKHMLYFITNKFTPLKNNINNILEECKDYDEYHNLFCIYTNVASLAKDNLSEAKHICNQLKDEHLIGECKFYIASSIVMNINKDTPKKINLINGICKEINNTNWRSECYYILADELAMTKPEYLEEIANACRKSNLAIDYACFDHVTYLMPVERIMEFCNLLKNNKEKIDCFDGWGHIISRKGDISLGISTCNKFSVEFRNKCFLGLSYGIGRHFSPNISSGIPACNKIPIEFRNNCFLGLGEGIGRHFSRDLSSAISTCNEVPDEFKSSCFKGLGKGIGGSFDRNIFIAISKSISSGIPTCNKIPLEFRNNCFRELSKGVGQHFSRDISSGIPICNKFPPEFRNNCFNNLKGANI